MNRADDEVVLPRQAESAGDRAVALFGAGFNCAESTVAALLVAAGRPPGDAQRLATAFGGGLARRGGVCGALAGAAMALSTLLGRRDAEDTDGKDRVYAAVERLLQRFETAQGSIMCRELTGLDFHDPASHEVFKASVKGAVCVPAIRLVVRAALDELATVPKAASSD